MKEKENKGMDESKKVKTRKEKPWIPEDQG